MKRIVLMLIAAMLFVWQGTSFADSSVDALIQKLQDKGILTSDEATQLKGEVAAKEDDSTKATFKSMLPDWLNTIKFTGDFRLRDQFQVRQVPLTSAGKYNFHRNRGRIRARLQLEDQITDKFKVIVGIATDGGSSRSNNYTFGGNGNNSVVTTAHGGYANCTNGNCAGTGINSLDSFGESDVVLRKAYAIYTPWKWMTVKAGKMDNPIWEPGPGGAASSFFWDPNITPEGGSIQFEKKLSDYITPFVQGDVFVLGDNSPAAFSSSPGTRTDPYMTVLQAGAKGNLTDKVYYKAAFNYYDVTNPSHYVFEQDLGTNTLRIGNNGLLSYRYNFNDIVGGAVELGINDPFGDLLPAPIYVPQIGIFGEYAQNNASQDKQNKSWGMGAYMGNTTVSGWGTWKISTLYRVIEKDAWLDIFPNADFYSGDTDTKGWQSELDIGLAKNLYFSLTYFQTDIFKDYSAAAWGALGALGGTTTFKNTSAAEQLFQADLNFKF